MKTKIINGTKIAKSINQRTKLLIKKHHLKPRLAIIMFRGDKATSTYVKMKKEMGKKLGIQVITHSLPNKMMQGTVDHILNRLNIDNEINAITVELPLPKHLNEDITANFIRPDKDVDGFSPFNVGNLSRGGLYRSSTIACTAQAIMRIFGNIESKMIKNLQGKHVVIINRSNVVGRPLAHLMINVGAEVTVLNHYAKPLSRYTKDADILVSATGHKNLINGNMIKQGADIIDVSQTGDVNDKSVMGKAKLLTKPTHGVGPITVAELMLHVYENTLLQHEVKQSQNHSN